MTYENKFSGRTSLPLFTSYDGNYYKTLVKELSSDIWEFINEDQNKLASIQVIKQVVQTFVIQLQSKNEGIKDSREYELVKDSISSFLIDTALEDVTNNIFHLPEPQKYEKNHRFFRKLFFFDKIYILT